MNPNADFMTSFNLIKSSIPEMTERPVSEDHCIATVLCTRYIHCLLFLTVLHMAYPVSC